MAETYLTAALFSLPFPESSTNNVAQDAAQDIPSTFSAVATLTEGYQILDNRSPIYDHNHGRFQVHG